MVTQGFEEHDLNTNSSNTPFFRAARYRFFPQALTAILSILRYITYLVNRALINKLRKQHNANCAKLVTISHLQEASPRGYDLSNTLGNVTVQEEEQIWQICRFRFIISKIVSS
jgi:hypothetical protein